jgi:uncharacterized protein (DUF1330 family)
LNYISFDKEKFNQFRGIEDSRPLHMLNLIKLNNEVRYPDGEITSGKEAYRRYGKDSSLIFKKLGGKIVWRGDMLVNLIGPETETWDISFIAEYPDVDAFVSMQKDPVYREAVKHRQLAVLDSRLSRMGPMSEGSNFAF